MIRRLYCLIFHASYIQRGSMGKWHWWDCRRCGTVRIWEMTCGCSRYYPCEGHSRGPGEG